MTREPANLIAVAVTCLFPALRGAIAAPAPAPYPPKATGAEQRALDQLASELEGFILYTRPPSNARGEKSWMIEKIRIGEWQPVTVGSALFARWSPDGRQIAFANPGSVGVMGADGSRKRKLCDGAAGQGRLRPCPIDFHSDGEHIIFIRQRGGVSMVNIESGEVRDMGLPGPYTAEPQISADGTLFVARWQSAGGTWAEQRRMVVVDIPGNIGRLYGAGCGATVSPDGRWFTINTGGHDTMLLWHRGLKHVAEIDAKKMVAPHHSWDNFHWSNHNDYMAVRSDGRWAGMHVGPEDAYVIRVSKRRATRVTFGVEAEYPDLLVTKDLATGETHAGSAGIGKSATIAELAAVPGDPMASFKPAGSDTNIPRTRVIALLELRSSLPDKGDLVLLEYENYLAEYVYRVTQIMQGEVESDRIVVAHWAVRDRRLLSGIAAKREGRSYRLTLEPFAVHKELSGEGKFPADPDKIDLSWPVFFDTSPIPKPPPRPVVRKPPKLPSLDAGDDLELDL